MWVLFKTEPKREKNSKSYRLWVELQQYEVKYHQESFKHYYALTRNIAQNGILMMRRGFFRLRKDPLTNFFTNSQLFHNFFAQMWTTFV